MVEGISPLRGSPIQAESQIYTQVRQVQQQPFVPPDALEIRQKVFKDYGIKIIDSDVKFNRAEVEVINETLEKIAQKYRQHLRGVKEIVKNKKQRVKLKKKFIHAGGAYDEANRRVYLFDNLEDGAEMEKVLTHEIGHAVNYYNLLFDKFMEFVKINDWQAVEFRPIFNPDNEFYSFGLRKIMVPPEELGKVWPVFSLNSLAENRDTSGSIVLEPRPESTWTPGPWSKNPLEQFATLYELFMNERQTFKKLTKKDPTLARDWDFLKTEVFSKEALGENALDVKASEHTSGQTTKRSSGKAAGQEAAEQLKPQDVPLPIDLGQFADKNNQPG